jgi:transposase
LSTKIHLLTDSQGIPLAVHLTCGQRHESTCLEILMRQVRLPGPQGRPVCRPRALAADKGYSYPRIRQWLRAHRVQAVIPQRSDQIRQHRGRPLSFDRQTYRQRNAVERCIGRLKECRRIATRYDKYAESFAAMIDLARTRQYLKLILSDTA